jgi:hypothetical protein
MPYRFPAVLRGKEVYIGFDNARRVDGFTSSWFAWIVEPIPVLRSISFSYSHGFLRLSIQSDHLSNQKPAFHRTKEKMLVMCRRMKTLAANQDHFHPEQFVFLNQ